MVLPEGGTWKWNHVTILTALLIKKVPRYTWTTRHKVPPLCSCLLDILLFVSCISHQRVGTNRAIQLLCNILYIYGALMLFLLLFKSYARFISTRSYNNFYAVCIIYVYVLYLFTLEIFKLYSLSITASSIGIFDNVIVQDFRRKKRLLWRWR